MAYLIEDVDSSLIKTIEYNPDTRELRLEFRKYFVNELTYENVPFNYFEEISNPIGKSYGQFYLQMIKQNFKHKTKNAMAKGEKPVTVNYEQGTNKRFIKMSIDVSAASLNKDLLVPHESGKVFLHMTLQMLPEGKTDKYGNLGMITQDVPSSIYEKEKHLPVAQRTQGKILGNGAEFERRAPAGSPGDSSGETLADMSEEERDKIADDLPF